MSTVPQFWLLFTFLLITICLELALLIFKVDSNDRGICHLACITLINDVTHQNKSVTSSLLNKNFPDFLPNDIFYSLEILGDDSVLFGQSVDTIIGFTHTTNLTANSVGLVGAGHSSRGLINVRNIDLNRGVIFGSDDTIASRAVKSVN